MWLCQLCLRTPVVLHHHWHTDMSAYSYDKKGRVQLFSSFKMSAVLKKKALRRNSPHNKDIAILEKLLYFLYLSKPLRMILLFHKTSSEVQFFVLFVI